MAAESTATGPVVVGIDGSEASLTALRRALDEARWRNVDLHVVHVRDVSPAVLHLAGDRTITTRELAESDRAEVWKLAGPLIDDTDIDVIRVERDGDPGQSLVAHCDDVGASVLVVGPRGRGMMKRLLLGSTAEEAVKTAGCDVLLVKWP